MDGLWIPMDVTKCAPSCCCAVGLVTVKTLDNKVHIEGPVTGGPACYYQDNLSADLVPITPTLASLSLQGEPVLNVSLTGGMLHMIPIPSPTCATDLIPVTSESQIASLNDVKAWTGVFDVEDGSCVPSPYCCCATGEITIAATNQSQSLNQSADIELPIPSFMIQGQTDKGQACGNATDITASFMLFNSTTGLSADRSLGVTSNAVMMDSGNRVVFNSNYFECTVALNKKSSEVPFSASQQIGGSLGGKNDSRQNTTHVQTDTQNATKTQDQEQNANMEQLIKPWAGIYNMQSGCVPGPRCCCAKDPIQIENVKGNASSIRITANTDGGMACFNRAKLSGVCSVLPDESAAPSMTPEMQSLVATCVGEATQNEPSIKFTVRMTPTQAQREIAIQQTPGPQAGGSMNITRTLTMENTLYPDCPSTAVKSEPSSGTGKAPPKKGTQRSAGVSYSALSTSQIVSSALLLVFSMKLTK